MTTLPSIAETLRADQVTMAPSAETAGWFDDPEGRHHLRYFDGDSWTPHVTHFGPSPCVACRVNGS